MNNTMILCLSALTLCLAARAEQETGWGQHKRMFAVPAPGKVVIDGKLDDWDLSGQIECYVMAATREMQSAKCAIMYDAEALYVSGVVRSPRPMLNRHSPEAEGDNAWNADSLQLRLVVDPSQGYPVIQTTHSKEPNDQMAHLVLWYYTDRKEPNLQMKLGMGYLAPPGSEKFGVIPKDKFQAAYRMADDKQGYTFEYRIPWATLGAKNPPQGGDVISGTFQFNWSRPDGLKTAGIGGWAYDLQAYAGFAYQNSGCWGKIVFSKEGHLPKELVNDGVPPQKPLPLTFEYDLPDDGQVSIMLLNEKNEVARVLAAQAPRPGGHVVEKWDGLDDLELPLPAGKYVWKGLVHQPVKTQFVLSVNNSGQPPYKQDDNTGGWGADHSAPATALSVGQDMLLGWPLAETGWGIIRTSSDGKKIWGSNSGAAYLASDDEHFFAAGGFGFDVQTGVLQFDLKDARPLPFKNGAAGLTPPPGGEAKANTVTGLACSNGTVFVSYQARNLIALYDSKSGELKKTWEVPAPGQIAALANGSLLVASQGGVASLRDGKADAFLADHLDEPAGIAVDAQGVIYVANAGKLQNVSVFSPDGKYVKSIGKEGGRPKVGRFDPAGMLQPDGIAIDAKGRLWVAENSIAPKRHSVWDTKDGTLAKEFFGCAHYSTFAWMDPEHPDRIFCDGAEWQVDLDKKTWSCYATTWRPADKNAVPTPDDCFFRVFTTKNGHQYGFGGGALYMRVDDVFKPLLWLWWQHPKNTPPILAGKHFATYAWVDANDDQVMQENELTEIGPSTYRSFHWVDKDLNIWHNSGCMRNTGKKDGKGNPVFESMGRAGVFRPLRIEPDGRPVYDFTKPDPSPVKGADVCPIFTDPDDGSIYTVAPSKPPADNIGFGRWTPDGKLLWGYKGVVAWPKALNLPSQRPGKLWGAICPLCTAGDFTGVCTYFGTYHVLTRDGVYVAMLMRDQRAQPGLGADVNASETWNGQLVKIKERYYLLHGDQDGRVQEVTGLDTVKRLPGGEYTITGEDAQKVEAAMKDYYQKKALSQRLVIVRGRKALDMAPPVEKSVDANQSFLARAAYDADNLYVSFDVASPHELVNAAAEPKLIFKSGNLLDIQIGTDPEAGPQRKQPAPGDVRVLVSQKDGKPVAVVFRPKVKSFQGEPIVLNSPTGKEPFDAIETCDRVKLEYRKEKNAPSFTAIVTIPLDVLAWKPRPGTKIKMDLGYIFGNATGMQATLRSYWSNNSFSANVLNDVPNESRLEPAEWGQAEVE